MSFFVWNLRHLATVDRVSESIYRVSLKYFTPPLIAKPFAPRPGTYCHRVYKVWNWCWIRECSMLTLHVCLLMNLRDPLYSPRKQLVKLYFWSSVSLVSCWLETSHLYPMTSFRVVTSKGYWTAFGEAPRLHVRLAFLSLYSWYSPEELLVSEAVRSYLACYVTSIKIDQKCEELRF
jgi:hypothetical protein